MSTVDGKICWQRQDKTHGRGPTGSSAVPDDMSGTAPRVLPVQEQNRTGTVRSTYRNDDMRRSGLGIRTNANMRVQATNSREYTTRPNYGIEGHKTVQ